jgi:hypothetical protein
VTNVGVAIMAHKRRASFVPELLAKLDRSATVVWDERDDRWDTGRRSLLAYRQAEDQPSHWMVVQDDAVIPRDLVAGVEKALEYVPVAPLCLYAGRVRPFRQLVQHMVNQTTGGTSWLSMNQLHWGVGIVMPVELIDACVEWGDARPEIPNYDRRISRWCQHERLTVYYPWPSLVDHRDSPSLVPGRGSSGRRAHRFIGADVSVLDRRWDGTVVSMPTLNAAHLPAPARRHMGGHVMRFVNYRYPNLHIPQLGVRFRDGAAEVTGARATTVLQSPWWRRRGVMPADEAPPVPPPAEPTVATAVGDGGVPTGTAGDVLAWVGEEPDRARLALDAEQQRDRPRSTLIRDLTRVANQSSEETQ